MSKKNLSSGINQNNFHINGFSVKRHALPRRTAIIIALSFFAVNTFSKWLYSLGCISFNFILMSGLNLNVGIFGFLNKFSFVKRG